MRECISIHIGQAGIQTGEQSKKKCWIVVFVDVLQAGRFPTGCLGAKHNPHRAKAQPPTAPHPTKRRRGIHQLDARARAWRVRDA